MSTEKIVRDHAKLIHLSNKISSMHEKNMKMFPYIFFEDVEKCEIEYDFSHRPVNDAPKEDAKNMDDFYKEVGKAMEMTSNSIVSYHLTLKEKKNKKHIEKRFAAIERAIRDLFWNDVTVEVYFNDKIVFKSAK